MSNFAGDEGTTVYTEPEGSLVYQGMVSLTADYGDERVGLCMIASGGGSSVVVGINDEADVQQFLYAAAVRSQLIKDGEPLILMKRVTADEDAA